MEVEFMASPDSIVTWLRNGKEIKNDETFEIVTTENKSTIKVAKLDKKVSGKYEIVIKESTGVTKSSSSVNLTSEDLEVTAPKFVKIYPQCNVQMEEVVILETVVTAIPNASFQWFLNAKPIVSGEDNMHIAHMINKSVLMIENITKENAGEITCRAENVAGSITCTSTMNVLEKDVDVKFGRAPEFVVEPIGSKVMDGEEIKIQCQIKAKPAPLVTWSHNDRDVKRREDVFISQDMDGVCELIIKEAFPELAGVYKCHAANKFGTATCTTHVVVEGKISARKYSIIHKLPLIFAKTCTKV